MPCVRNGKHHQAYIDTVNELVAGTARAEMSPAQPPPPSIKPLIQAGIGGMYARNAALAATAARRFGSGWVWLVLEGGTLRVVDSANTDMPATPGCWPLLNIDVWENACHLDFQNRCADHVKAVLDKLIHGSFAADNLG
jgi:superoxide dismutase, Fe-Mn family